MPERGPEDMKAHFTRLVPFLLTKIILPLIKESEKSTSSNVMADDSVLDVVGRLVNILIRPLGVEEQTSIAEQMFNLFFHGLPCQFIPTSSREKVAESFGLFRVDAGKEPAGCVIVFAYALAALRREVRAPEFKPMICIFTDSLLLQVDLPIKSLEEFLQQRVELATRPRSPAHRIGHLHIIGLVINKWIKAGSEPLQRITHELLGSVFGAGLKEFSVLVDEKLRITFWIAKALVLRGDKFGMEITGQLVELLENSAYGATASKGFAALIGDDDFLNKENYAIVRLLAKQRVFTFCVPKIVGGFKGADSGSSHFLYFFADRYPKPTANVFCSCETKLPYCSLQYSPQYPLHSYPYRVTGYPPSPPAVTRPSGP